MFGTGQMDPAIVTRGTFTVNATQERKQGGKQSTCFIHKRRTGLFSKINPGKMVSLSDSRCRWDPSVASYMVQLKDGGRVTVPIKFLDKPVRCFDTLDLGTCELWGLAGNFHGISWTPIWVHWDVQNLFHRLDGPAYCFHNKPKSFSWFQKDQRHRTDGQCNDAWYVNGKCCTRGQTRWHVISTFQI